MSCYILWIIVAAVGQKCDVQAFSFNLNVATLVCVLLLQWRCRKVNSTWECFSTLLCTGTSILCLSFSLCPRDFVCSQVRCGLLLDFHREHSALHPVLCSPHLCMCRTFYWPLSLPCHLHYPTYPHLHSHTSILSTRSSHPNQSVVPAKWLTGCLRPHR